MKESLLFFLKISLPLYFVVLCSPAFGLQYGAPDTWIERFMASKFVAFVAAMIGLFGIGCFVTGGGRTAEGNKRILLGLISLAIAGGIFFFRTSAWRAWYTGY